MRLASLLVASLLAFPIVAVAVEEGAQPERDSPAQADVESTKYDPDIYLPMPTGTRVLCGKIVSYNFTQGVYPELRNVTTCTPFSHPAVKRARRPAPRREPQLQLTLQPVPEK